MESRTKASQSIADGKGLKESIAFHEAQFTLTTSNFEGKECYNKRDNVTVEIRDEQGRDCATDLRITDNKDGLYQISYSARNEGRCEVTVKVNGEHVRGSQFFVLVKPFQFRPVLSFGEAGSTLGKFDWPWGVTVNARNEIAVTDKNNDRVQIFSSEGKYLRSFGKVGDKAGEFNKPRGITFHSNGKIFVADSFNHRIQIFEEAKNEPVGSFGSKGNHDSQLKSPMGSSVDSDGNIIVADRGNNLVKIFSSDGKFLRKIGKQVSFIFPVHCIQYDRYLIVSDREEHCIKVFDTNGNFLYKFGKEGVRNGELNYPTCLSVNKSGHIMVCDSYNGRIQVFELNGKFVGKFGTVGKKNVGEFMNPNALASLSTGRFVVVDSVNRRIQITE
ncbi:E3 ubiquitin-protein ligase TRIM71-like [Stylophora pistillata]|uniref:E3 ubiquitin-protein ligase TRIM71-like n=1 Tax=Stylophora pistillata TaxID=50429 RepID=UPI000C050F68|nr:E3 ubiquitin-protein ligase TRIM71-like [Stylophora pistillata]